MSKLEIDDDRLLQTSVVIIFLYTLAWKSNDEKVTTLKGFIWVFSL